MGARILVADDSVTIQKVIELTFSKEDFQIIPARTGEEAIRKAKEVRPDLMLIDTVMPDKSGYEICRVLKADPLLKDVPVIFLPGTFEAFDRNEAFKAGAEDFVTKPFESQTLLGKVKQLLFSRSTHPFQAPPRVQESAKEEVSREELFQLLETPAEAVQEEAAPPTPHESFETPLQNFSFEGVVLEEVETPEEEIVHEVTEEAGSPEELFAFEPLEPSFPSGESLGEEAQIPPLSLELTPEPVSFPVESPPETTVVPPSPPAAPEVESLHLQVETAQGFDLREAARVATEQVVERVSHDVVDLARDRADQLSREIIARLVDRLEQVIWEVVPELAEVLIKKEIERIREAVEGKGSEAS